MGKLAAILVGVWGILLSGGAFAADAGKDTTQAKPTETTVRLTSREIIKKLQLTADQKKKFLHSRHAYKKAMAYIDGQMKVSQVDLENELEKPEPDQTKLDATVQKIGNLYGQKLAEKIKAKLEFERNILTPQQLDLLKTLQGKDAPEENL